MNRERGAAMILVLMIVGILGLLSLQVGLSAKEHVARAERLQRRTEAQLRLQSNEAALVFTLLTQPWLDDRSRTLSANPFVRAWNFHDQPFEVDGIRYAIQDVKGLLPMPQIADPLDPLERMLVNMGVDAQRARRVAEQIRENQDVPDLARDPNAKRVPWQSLDELREFVNLSPEEFARFERMVSLYPLSEFNPLTAPIPVLGVRFDGGLLDTLRTLRDKNELDADTFIRTTGKGDDEFTVFYPGPALRIGTFREGDGFRLRRESTLVLRPHDFEPVQLWGRKRLFAASEYQP